ncbi:SusC/RagA family TonB-linked outer membrane protein [Cytophagaceae bacterium DM2B3-1]|uniref:SusC/RagA family TonB-linked outer membrane protein n=1 Tax=Xanthocytophaga flava TaxID=3048013 RepID=A0ABT7CK20_9BACT|nr:SusC/RagA family TonB-linked outer membrane protein [Xanthocytophaga flavus]MDJ1494089.1 SusC/RagA family TonB-linked outer membrane protein [Xanthocytophaga flavus]
MKSFIISRPLSQKGSVLSLFALFFLFLGLLQAQSKDLNDARLTIKVENATLGEVFKIIEDKTNYHFTYNDAYLNIKQLVSVNAENKTLTEILTILAKSANFQFKQVNTYIHVTSQNESRKTETGNKVSKPEATVITGTIVDDNNQALPGVSVVLKGTATGTTTDAQGKYSISIPDNTGSVVLVFTFIGYTTEEVTVGSRTQIDVQLIPDIKALSEVVVVGYGTQKKSDLTGSIAVVKAEEVKKFATNDVAQLLQGRAPGVAVTSDGQPGAAPSVKIRGVGTFGNIEPLYVIDGVPVGTSPRDFNPNDVESIQVLKDASAGAIYGSRAANGVIIITTKRGKKDTPLKVEYSGYFGVDKVWQIIPVTQREQYQMLNNESQTNGGQPLAPGNDPNDPAYISNIDTDWQKEGLKTGTRQNHSLNFSGGSKTTMYSFSADYFSSNGTLVGKGPTYDRYSIRANSESEKGIFKIGESLYYTHSHENALTNSANFLAGGRPPLVGDLVMAIPTMPIYDSNRKGGYGGTSSIIEKAISLNVIGLNRLINNYVDVDRTFANVYTEVKLLKNSGHNLKYKLNLSYDRTITRDYYFQPVFDLGYFFQSSIAKLDDNSRVFSTGLVENTLNYEKTFEKHTLAILAGQMFQKGDYLFRGGHAEGFTEPYYPTLGNGSSLQTVSSRIEENAIYSFLGRLNYSFDDRYLLTATIRRDGSSRFASVNRYGDFSSVALGWKLHNEKFFQNLNLPFISDLKLRGSYGQLGNENIPNYLYYSIINSNVVYNFGGTKVTGATQTQLVSETIKWESKTSSNIGLDATFLNGKFDLTVEYYNNKTTDALLGVPIPTSTGATNIPTVNAASLRNYGVEFSVGYHKTTGDFKFDIAANAYTLKNKVLALGANDEPVYGTGAKTQVGGEVGKHFGYKVEGVFQNQEEIDNHATQEAGTAPGDLKYKDINNDNVINEDDRTYLGSALPTIYYGMNFSAQYKNFDFTFFASGSGGNKINSRLYRDLMHTTDYINYHKDALNRWTPTNPNNEYPRLAAGDPNNNQRDSDRKGWLQSGTYLRINTVSLGYKLPENLIKGISNARIYITGQNLYNFQAYKGYNPDFTSGTWNPGFDYGSFPKSRTVLLGIQVGF